MIIQKSEPAGVSPRSLHHDKPPGVGESLPDMPLFLAAGHSIAVPLEATYATAWTACPEALREAVG